jgi:rsbT antagonist protein RsbS
MTQNVPVLRLGDALLVSIQVDLQDDDVLALQEELAERIVSTGARGVIIDISAVDIVDSFIGRMFSSIAALSRVLDAETVVVGMRPAVAITLVELGLSMEGVRTALDLEKGKAILDRLIADRRSVRDLDELDGDFVPLDDPAGEGSRPDPSRR